MGLGKFASFFTLCRKRRSRYYCTNRAKTQNSPYRLTALPDDIGQLVDDEINALGRWLLHPRNLLFGYGLEGHVRREETDSAREK